MRNIFAKKHEPWKGLVGGLLSGLAGTIVMTQFQNAWNKTSEMLSQEGNGAKAESKGSEEKEDATMKAAGKISSAAGYELSRDEKKKAGPFVHYGFGTAMGAAYGLAKETVPRSWQRMHPALSGSGFGTALFLGADEIALPALNLADKPSKAPASSHLYGLASHLVYGLTVAAVYKGVRHLL